MSTLCPKCGEVCDEAEFKIHKANKCQPTVKCPLCLKHVSNLDALVRHTRAVHHKEFECIICKKDCRSKYDLERHIQAVHDKQFICPICQKEFSSKYNLRSHLAWKHKHMYNEKKAQECEKCGEVFICKYQLKRHIERVHSESIPCSLCNAELGSDYHLSLHMRREHGQKISKAKVDCPKCGKLITRSSLEYHLKTRHNPSLTCYVCEKEFSRQKALQKHIEFRHREEFSEEVLLRKKFKCPICPQRFMSEWTLKTHMNAKHEEQYRCEICKKLFSSPHSLMRHRTNVHKLTANEDSQSKSSSAENTDEESKDNGELPSTSLKVKLKKEEGTNKKSLNEKRKHKCHLCPKSYTAPWMLKKHIKGKHEGQFKCEVCKKLFSAPFPLMRHRSNIHGLHTEIESAETKSVSNEKDLDTDGECEDYDDLPSKSLEVKIEEEEATS